MPTRVYTYRVEIDNRQAAAQAAQMRAIFERQLNNIQLRPNVVPGGGRPGGAPSAPGYSGFADMGGAVQWALGGAIGGYGLMQAGRAILEMDTQATAYRRVSMAALELAGSQEKLNSLMMAYTRASGGAVDQATALQQVTQLQAIGFADSAEELERFVTAARGASIATGQSMDYIVSQLQLAIANQSTMRLDQLGLGVTEVKNRIDELQAANSDLSGEMAYQEAILGALQEKYGDLARSAEAAATGQELLSKAIKDARLAAAEEASDWFDTYMRGAAIALTAMTGGEQDLRNLDIKLAERQQVRRKAPDELQAEWQAARDAIEAYNEALASGETWVSNYAGYLGDLAEEAYRGADASEENTSKLENLTATFQQGAPMAYNMYGALEDLAVGVDNLGDAAVETTSKYQELLDTIAGGIGDSAVSAAQGLIQRGLLSPEQAASMLEAARVQQSGYRASFENQKLTGDALAIAEAMARRNVLSPFEQIEEDDRARKEAAREAQRIAERAARDQTRHWERAVDRIERAHRDAASTFLSKLEQIPGLFGTSPVTAQQQEMAEYGMGQNFVDDYLRRLRDEVLNEVDWEGVDVRDAARRIGMDPNANPRAILARFEQAWADSSLFANPQNLELLNQAAIQAGLERQRMAEMGRSNILEMAGLGEDSQGVFFTGLGDTIASGMIDGAGDGLERFANYAIQDMVDSLRSDMALVQYADAGGAAFDAMYDGFTERASSSGFVNVIVAAVMSEINAGLEE